MEAALVVCEGKHKDRKVLLPETIFMIGRDRQCHLRPHCHLVSKLHCAIAAWAGKVRVRDLKSRNGTFLNGERINGEVLVKDGDRLQVGSLLFVFKITVDDGSPEVLPVFENDMKWLLDSPSDSAVLAPTSPTETVLIPPDLKPEATEGSEGTAAAALAAQAPDDQGGSKAVSAGQNLREYFKVRKKAAAAVAAKNQPAK